ncbi:unnamed protein product, partial [Rhizoctonia solani]
VSLLLINAVAILNEERFLARIGWSSVGPQPGQQYNQYDRTGYGEGGSEVKSKLINLIGAVRTLLRSKLSPCYMLLCLTICPVPLIVVNIVVILYELAWG